MALRVNVGLSRKQGLPDYGSLGASCSLDFELEGSLLEADAERFRQRVREAYEACAQAVQEELARQRSGCEPAHAALAAGRPHGNGRNGHSGAPRPASRPATPAQLRALRAIAQRLEVDLSPSLAALGAEALEELTVSQASQLIDELQSLAHSEAAAR